MLSLPSMVIKSNICKFESFFQLEFRSNVARMFKMTIMMRIIFFKSIEREKNHNRENLRFEEFKLMEATHFFQTLTTWKPSES